MITDSFLMGILDETEEGYVTVLACLRKPTFPLVSIAFSLVEWAGLCNPKGGASLTRTTLPPVFFRTGRKVRRMGNEWSWRDREALNNMQCVYSELAMIT